MGRYPLVIFSLLYDNEKGILKVFWKCDEVSIKLLKKILGGNLSIIALLFYHKK
jgi:hypothetical protein